MTAVPDPADTNPTSISAKPLTIPRKGECSPVPSQAEPHTNQHIQQHTCISPCFFTSIPRPGPPDGFLLCRPTCLSERTSDVAGRKPAVLRLRSTVPVVSGPVSVYQASNLTQHQRSGNLHARRWVLTGVPGSCPLGIWKASSRRPVSLCHLGLPACPSPSPQGDGVSAILSWLFVCARGEECFEPRRAGPSRSIASIPAASSPAGVRSRSRSTVHARGIQSRQPEPSWRPDVQPTNSPTLPLSRLATRHGYCNTSHTSLTCRAAHSQRNLTAFWFTAGLTAHAHRPSHLLVYPRNFNVRAAGTSSYTESLDYLQSTTEHPTNLCSTAVSILIEQDVDRCNTTPAPCRPSSA